MCYRNVNFNEHICRYFNCHKILITKFHKVLITCCLFIEYSALKTIFLLNL